MRPPYTASPSLFTISPSHRLLPRNSVSPDQAGIVWRGVPGGRHPHRCPSRDSPRSQVPGGAAYRNHASSSRICFTTVESFTIAVSAFRRADPAILGHHGDGCGPRRKCAGALGRQASGCAGSRPGRSGGRRSVVPGSASGRCGEIESAAGSPRKPSSTICPCCSIP